MSDPIFLASQMKVHRAKQFIGELEAELERFRASNPVRAKIRVSGDQGQVLVDWDAIGLLPGAIVGDAIHNMRTALDLMASELARIRNESDRGVYFPFARSEEELPIQIREKKFYRAGEDAVSLLIRFAPYVGGSLPLRAIHDLDILDKHRALIPAGSKIDLKLTGVIPLDDEGHYAGAEDSSIQVDIASLGYSFPPDTPFDGQLIIETLKQLVELVEEILQSFATLVTSRAK